MKHPFCLILLLMNVLPLHADVFSLYPFRGGGGGGVAELENAASGSRLWKEEVVINGHHLELEVALVNRTLEDVLREFRGQFKNGAAAKNSNSLLFEIPQSNGAKKRCYLVDLGGIVPMLQFSLLLPADFNRKNTVGVWDPELPLPSGASAQSLMRFPKRKSIYGTFQSPFSIRQTLSDLVRTLESRGWRNVGGETAVNADAGGEVFLQEKRNEIMIISVKDLPDGRGSVGSLYLHKLAK
ncbi:MAG: hypothetical protein J5806_08125 [Lentisphaeria bacterium]|nr:hypothetical protein [Lentisphaeria bacterium]